MPLRHFLLGSWLFASSGAPGGMERRQMRRNPFLMLLTIGIILDLIISGVLITLTIGQRENASSAHISRVAAYGQCVALNKYKASDLVRWERILGLLDVGTSRADPELKHFLVGAQQQTDVADAPQVCDPP